MHAKPARRSGGTLFLSMPLALGAIISCYGTEHSSTNDERSEVTHAWLLLICEQLVDWADR